MAGDVGIKHIAGDAFHGHHAGELREQHGVVDVQRGKLVADDKVVPRQMLAQHTEGGIQIAVADGFAPFGIAGDFG